jgi:hypothetical protein
MLFQNAQIATKAIDHQKGRQKNSRAMAKPQMNVPLSRAI